MKVKKLIKLLEKCDPEMEVIMKSDAEGNSYTPLSGIDDNFVYLPSSSYHGEAYYTKFTAHEMCMTEKEWNKIKRKKHSLVLIPTN